MFPYNKDKWNQRGARIKEEILAQRSGWEERGEMSSAVSISSLSLFLFVVDLLPLFRTWSLLTSSAHLTNTNTELDI